MRMGLTLAHQTVSKNYIKPFLDELVALGIVMVERKVKGSVGVVLDAERFFKLL